jgi:uncharacterized RDD family membrane protein YckC
MATATTATPHGPLETSVRLVTPERITFLYPLAGPFHRACSYLLDIVVVTAVLIGSYLVALAVTLFSEASLGLMLVITFAVYFFYGATCEGLFNGRTVGKLAFGLRVVSTEGVPITGAQAVLRNLLWAFDGIWPFAYLPAVACMVLTRRFQRLGDLAAGTMVIVERRPRTGRVDRPDNRDADRVLLLLPTTPPAGSELSKALSDYVKARKRFTRARLEEMGEHLARPFRKKYDLPATMGADAILCALYRRVFLGD